MNDLQELLTDLRIIYKEVPEWRRDLVVIGREVQQQIYAKQDCPCGGEKRINSYFGKKCEAKRRFDFNLVKPPVKT